MTGHAYAEAMRASEMERIAPDDLTRKRLHAAIVDELCRRVFRKSITRQFLDAIEG